MDHFFELDTEEGQSDLELTRSSRLGLKFKPTQPALEVEEEVEDRCKSVMSSQALETRRYCLVAFACISSESASNGLWRWQPKRVYP
jgi:hypothetical protein